MESTKVETKKAKGKTVMKRAWAVSKNGPNAIAKIGHTNLSMTFLPDILKSDSTNSIFIDMPGFLDDRGFELAIANSGIASNPNDDGSISMDILAMKTIFPAGRFIALCFMR